MKNRFILLIAAIALSVASFSQIFEPIKWSYELKNTGKNSATIVMKASIDKGWHLYGMTIPKDGPRPTTFVFEELVNAKLEGGVSSKSKLLEVYDPNFDMKLNWYKDAAIFEQKISFDDFSNVRIKGYVEFMACDDQSCLPPNQDYFDLGNKNAKASQVNAITAAD